MAAMPAPMSLDLRRIVAAVEGGSSVREAARRFAVSSSAAIKLMQRVRATAPARALFDRDDERPVLDLAVGRGVVRGNQVGCQLRPVA
jgi:hypothetical protein